MKKCSLILIFFVFLAAGTFAQIEIGGSVGGGTTLFKGSNIRGDAIQAGNYLAGHLEAAGQDQTATFGGSVQINAEASTVDSANWGWGANVWWKPFYFSKLQMGSVNALAVTEIVGWDFHGNDAEDYVASPRLNYAGDYFSSTTGFYSGTGSGWTGVSLTVTPVYGLDINVAVPFGKGNEVRDADGKVLSKYNAEDVYLFTNAQIAYTLWDVGRLTLSFQARGNGTLTFIDDDGDPITPTPSPTTDGLRVSMLQSNAPSLYASFLFTALADSNFSMNLGFAYTLPAENKTYQLTYQPPLEAGLGISIGDADMGIKIRMAASFMGKIQGAAYDTVNEPLMLGLGILPYMSLGPCALYLNAGIAYKTEDEYIRSGYTNVTKVGNSAALAWHANPYMTMTFGTGRFYAGVTVESDGQKYTGRDKDTPINTHGGIESYPGQSIIEWGVPIGLLFEF